MKLTFFTLPDLATKPFYSVNCPMQIATVWAFMCIFHFAKAFAVSVLTARSGIPKDYVTGISML